MNLKQNVLATATAFAVAAGTAGAQKVTSDYDHNVNFSKFHTFSIYKVHASNGIVENRLRTGIAQALTSRGWQQVDNGGDVAVTAVGQVRAQQEYNTFYNGLGPGWGYGGWGGRWGWGGWGGGPSTATTTVSTIPLGILAVDLYDSSTHQLIFRGTASDQLSSKSDKNASKTQKAIDKIFDKLPKQKEG